MNANRRRLGFVLAAMIGGLAITIAALPLIQASGWSGSLDGPAIVPRPFVIATLLGLPAGLAAIAALRESRPMFIAAGVVCLLQSVVAFSGVTLGFVIPGILLVAVGLERLPTTSARPASGRRAWVAGVLVVSLAIAAWIVPFATGETVCWIARAGPDGNPVYTRIPESNTLTVGVGDLASGCDGGTFTLEGLMVGGVLAIGVLGMAALGASRPIHPAGSIT